MKVDVEINDLFDLQLAGGDLAFAPDDEPLFLSGTEVVAQDVRHRLRESGLPPRLLGAGEGERSHLLAAIAREAEEDQRIRPGTARVEPLKPPEPGLLRLTARTLAGEEINEAVGTQG